MSTLSTRLATALEAKYAAPRAKARSPASAHYHDTFSDCLTGAPEAGDAITDADYRDAMKRGGQLQHSLAAFLDQKYAAIIAAPAPGEAPAILDDSGDPGFRTMWILVGTPGITISTGNQANGMPPGSETGWRGRRGNRCARHHRMVREAVLSSEFAPTVSSATLNPNFAALTAR